MPMGASWEFLSRMRVRVLSIGRPIETGPFPERTLYAVDQIVVSVGP